MDIPFHKPIMPENIDSIFSESIKNGWLTTGPQVSQFEKIISEYFWVEDIKV